MRLAVVVGAFLAAALLAFHDHDWLAGLTLVAGLFAMGREAVPPLVHLILLVLSQSLIMFVWYLPHWFAGEKLFDFLSENRVIVMFYVFFVVSAFWQLRKETEETWTILKDHYAAPMNVVVTEDSVATATGFLVYEAEMLPLHVAVVETGVVFVRDAQKAIHIPWENMERISPRDANSTDTVDIKFNRSFSVNVPWLPAFDESIPDSVRGG